MNSRRLNMSNSEYRIELNSSNDLDQTETLAEEILHHYEHSSSSNIHPSEDPSLPSSTATPPTGTHPTLIERTSRPSNDDHLHQLIQFCKENLTSTFPFALILLLKGFYDHSSGKKQTNLSLHHHSFLRLIKEF